MSEAVVKRSVGIISIGYLRERFQDFVDEVTTGVKKVRTKIAENKYEKARKVLLEKAIGYAEDEYKYYAELLEKAKKMTPLEKREYLDRVREEREKESRKKIRTFVLSGIENVAEGVVTAITGQALLSHVLGLIGLTAPPATTLVSIGLSGGVFLINLLKLCKTNNLHKEEDLINNAPFMEQIDILVNEVKILCDILDESKKTIVEGLRDKKFKSSDIDSEMAKAVKQKIEEKGITFGALKIDNVLKAIKGDPSVEAEAKKEDEVEAEEEKAEEESGRSDDVNLENKTDEEQRKLTEEEERNRLLAEQELKKIEETEGGKEV